MMFTKVINFFIRFFTNTIGKLHWPWVQKEFPIEDYFEIEKQLSELNIPFAVGLVKTNGLGSNLLIGISQSLTKDKRKWFSNVSHAFAYIGYNAFDHSIVEAIESGLQETSLLKAIGQQDNVIIRVPNPQYLNQQVCQNAIDYLKGIIEKDKEKNIEYDIDHNYSNDSKLDCSETILQALEYGLQKAGHSNNIVMVERAGRQTWAPVDIKYSKLFVDFYVSKKGFVNGTIY